MKYSKSSPSGIFSVDDYIQFTLPSATYSIDDFNAKIKAAVLLQKQNWNALQIKNVKLVVPENYAFTANNNFFIALGVPEKSLKKINIKYSLIFFWLIQNITCYNASPKIIITTL